MTNTQFISALKKALAGLDKVSRNDIIEEIKSHALESGSPLIEQFGSAQELASQYLDGEKIAKPISSKIWGVSKKVLMILGFILLAIILLVALVSYFFTKDKFNYADENAKELSKNLAEWESQAWTSDLTLTIDQASTVLYWHDEQTLRWKCDGKGFEKQSDSSLKVHQSHCLIYLPKVVTALEIEQSQVVLVRPQVSLDINSNQASIQIAENGEKYKYAIDKSRSKLEDLLTHDEAKYTLQFKAKDSNISYYNY